MGLIFPGFLVFIGISDGVEPPKRSIAEYPILFYQNPATVNHPGKVSLSLAAAQQ